ncbi:uncharacterized protein NMK_2635 [Novimethylophilus kurashikiensis]|uniref:Uncharacterized protein n=1 Tax=Novimethylophilus kurashikiensis TaxID=1825523 RepID=A0A2R5FF92_9PROT|nr:hypothetical protein [Novimethylophilus kurashikiensis]GBG15034.1 uncharacterized protein NMK_2635 [Novimethylophilus kurashikiensis]
MSEHPHHHSSSLEDQIREREAHLLLRHEAVAARAHHLAGQFKHKVVQFKRKVTSPVVLLAAFGGGFILDRVIRMIPKRSRRVAPQAQGRMQQKPGFLTRLMEGVVLARSLLTAWPTSLIQRIISMWPSPAQSNFRSKQHYQPASAPVYPVDTDFYP